MRKLLIGESLPKGSNNSILVLFNLTKTVVTPCFGNDIATQVARQYNIRRYKQETIPWHN